MWPDDQGFTATKDGRLLSILNKRSWSECSPTCFDETVSRAPRPFRSSAIHLKDPFVFHVGGEEYKVQYLPAIGYGMFGGTPIGGAPSDAHQYAADPRALEPHSFYGDEFKGSMPTGSGR